MGGSSYDRDVYSNSSSSGWGTSSISASKLSRTTIDASMNPVGKVLKSNSKHPIIIMLDVTGSNINFARLVYDKMPMFYGQIEEQGYLDDFEILICAVGDAYTDDYPLQIGDFAKGIELDSWLEKLVLEGAGGGQRKESYELAAYYLLNKTEFIKDAKPMLFYIGDEAPYPYVNKRHIEEFNIGTSKALSIFRDSETQDISSNKKKGNYGIDDEIETSKVFEELRKKFNDNVFMYLNKYCGSSFEADITESWNDVLAPEHTIKIKEEKSIVDLMLGTIAMVSRKRDLDTYVVDLIGRGQDTKRISNVRDSLGNFGESLVPVVTTDKILPYKSKADSSDIRGSRL